MNDAPTLPVIRNLLCHAHVPMAMRCLGSLRRCHGPAFRLVIHDDGSLTDEDCARLQDALPGDMGFVRRAEADAALSSVLERYPACRRYRARGPMAIKLLDIPLLTGGGRLAYCDADILFLRPFSGFHRVWDTTDAPFIFARDLETVYSVRYFHVLGRRSLPFISRLNAGVMLVDTGRIDLDFIEHVLARLDAHGGSMPHLVEQTVWAALAARRPGACRFLSPEQVGFPPPSGAPPAECVALHFVGFLRDRLARTPERGSHADAPPVDLATVPARRLGRAEYAWSRLCKRVPFLQGKPA